MQTVQLFTLSSGMKCAFLPTVSPVSYCSLSTLAGTSFEPEGLGGLAHFCEHMLFKGTEKRSSYHINNRLERLGGEINAYTTKEELVLYATVLKEDTPKAMELMADLAFHSTVPLKELIKERQVVLDEIRSYKDSPMDLIYDNFEERLFAGTSMATPILGTSRTLRKINSEGMLDYLHRRFRPENMAFALVGHLTLRRAKELAEKFFGQSALPSAVLAPCSEAPLQAAPCAPAFNVTEKRNTYQLHCLLGTRAYDLHHKGRVPLVLLMNILGGPASNARLNMLLREKCGLVYTVEATYAPYAQTGFAGIYFGTDKPKLDQCLELVDKALAEYSQKALTGLQLDRAKKQLIGQLAVSADNPEAQCLSMGKSLLSFGQVPAHVQTVAMVNAVTAQEVLQAANENWEPSRRSTLIFI